MKKLYLMRHLWYYGDASQTIGLFKSWVDVLAYIANDYPDIAIELILPPHEDQFELHPITWVSLDSEDMSDPSEYLEITELPLPE